MIDIFPTVFIHFHSLLLNPSNISPVSGQIESHTRVRPRAGFSVRAHRPDPRLTARAPARCPRDA
jgi:hypothetical protein